MTQVTGLFASVLFSILMASQVLAFPLPRPGNTPGEMNSSADSNYDFNGIVALDNCSGSIVRFESSKDSDPAMVLTNGHCLESGFSAPGEVVSHQASSRDFRVLDSHAASLGHLTASEVIYSTMTKTDMTLYQTVETYAEIEKQFHVQALTLASKHPELMTKIEVISGYWKKGYSCSVDSFISNLKEDQWTFTDSIRYSRPGCETVGGTSGSPILQAGTRIVIGVNNTGNENGEKCSMNNPCEVSQDGKVTYEKGLTYGQETYWIYSCMNAQNKLDLSIAGCTLPK